MNTAIDETITPPVYTFYKSNIAPSLVEWQRKVFEHLDIPLIQCKDADIAQIPTNEAHKRGIEIDHIYPKFAVQSKWPLSNIGVFGIGTFYGDMEFFHLFESRKKQAIEFFNAVARDTVVGKFDFKEYLNIVRRRWYQWR